MQEAEILISAVHEIRICICSSMSNKCARSAESDQKSNGYAETAPSCKIQARSQMPSTCEKLECKHCCIVQSRSWELGKMPDNDLL